MSRSTSLAVGLLAEASLMLWFLVMGVNVQRWTYPGVRISC